MKIFSASAPGKFVVLGEHAVVFGKPAVALAIDRRFRCNVSESDTFIVNGERDDINKHLHVKYILSIHNLKTVNLSSEGDLPSGVGLGSSAALCASLSYAIRLMLGKSLDPEEIVKEAYAAEYYAQGIGSPMDTSASVHGGGVGLNIPGSEKLLWTIEKEDRKWDVCDVHAPEMTFVIGNTGKRALTGPLVEKVRRYRDSNRFAKDIVDEISNVTLEGIDALSQGDKTNLGRLMTENHKLLSILGVSCPELNRLVDAANEFSYGAKLTGAGGGGSMIALTDDPERVSRAIRLHGGYPMIVNTGVPGVKIEE